MGLFLPIILGTNRNIFSSLMADMLEEWTRFRTEAGIGQARAEG